MLEPERMRDIVADMQRSVTAAAQEQEQTPAEVTVKCRLGVDDCDGYEELHHFVDTAASAGVRHFVVHARECLLNGLSTKDSCAVPPLTYDRVRQLKQDFPHLAFTFNGGVRSIQHARHLLDSTPLDGVMIGRAYNTPWNFRDGSRLVFGAERNLNLSRRETIARYLNYAEELQAVWGGNARASSVPYTMLVSSLMRPLLVLFSGEFGGKAFKRQVTAQWAKKGPRPELRVLIENAMKVLVDEMLDARAEDELAEQQLLEEQVQD